MHDDDVQSRIVRLEAQVASLESRLSAQALFHNALVAVLLSELWDLDARSRLLEHLESASVELAPDYAAILRDLGDANEASGPAFDAHFAHLLCGLRELALHEPSPPSLPS